MSVLWQGRPVRRRLFRISDLAVATSVVAVSVLAVLLARVGFPDSSSSVLPCVLLLPPAGQLCMLVGQIAARALWWRRTGYVVTTRRVV